MKTMNYDYLVIYEKTGNGWSAYSPDVLGCVAAASTREEAETLMRDALQSHVGILKELGEPVPAPSSFGTLRIAA